MTSEGCAGIASHSSEIAADESPHDVATAANGSPDTMCPSLVSAKADSGTEHLDRPCPMPALPASARDAPGPKASRCFSSLTTDFESTVVIACSPSGNDRNSAPRHTPTRLISTKQINSSNLIFEMKPDSSKTRSISRSVVISVKLTRVPR